jgi:hypothetical protein
MVCFALLIRRGFRANSEPSYLERVIARSIRNFAIPNRSRLMKNPLQASAENLQTGRELFFARCANCHGIDGRGVTSTGQTEPCICATRIRRTPGLPTRCVAGASNPHGAWNESIAVANYLKSNLQRSRRVDCLNAQSVGEPPCL